MDLSVNKLTGAEARVVQLLVDGLSDGWFVIPRLDVAARRRPYEVDVLLIHPGYGLLAVEIKGGPFEIVEGALSGDKNCVRYQFCKVKFP